MIYFYHINDIILSIIHRTQTYEPFQMYKIIKWKQLYILISHTVYISMEAPNKYFCTRCEQEFKHLSGILPHQKSKKHETTCQKTLHSHMCSCGKQFQGIEAF